MTFGMQGCTNLVYFLYFENDSSSSRHPSVSGDNGVRSVGSHCSYIPACYAKCWRLHFLLLLFAWCVVCSPLVE